MGLEFFGETEILDSFRHTNAAAYHRDFRVVREDARERRNPIWRDPTVIIGKGDHITLREFRAKVSTSGDAARLRADELQTSIVQCGDGSLRLVAIALINHEQLVEAVVGQDRLDAGDSVVHTVPSRENHRNSKSTLAHALPRLCSFRA